MDRTSFDTIAAEEYAAVPERWRAKLDNVALLIEDGEESGLLGLYHGIPLSERGEYYSGVLPDTITLYYQPLLEEAGFLLEEHKAPDYPGAVRLAVRETLWHEIGHYFGLDDPAIHAREHEGTNTYDTKNKKPSTRSRWWAWWKGD